MLRTVLCVLMLLNLYDTFVFLLQVFLTGQEEIETAYELLRVKLFYVSH